MASLELDRLVQIGALKKEPPGRAEIEGLIRSGEARLADAVRIELSPESRFDLVYNATHALALAALEEDHDYLLAGGTFAEELIIERWIEVKGKEAAAVSARPHPHKFTFYYDL